VTRTRLARHGGRAKLPREGNAVQTRSETDKGGGSACSSTANERTTYVTESGHDSPWEDADHEPRDGRTMKSVCLTDHLAEKCYKSVITGNCDSHHVDLCAIDSRIVVSPTSACASASISSASSSDNKTSSSCSNPVSLTD
jgi:hypothetical protein